MATKTPDRSAEAPRESTTSNADDTAGNERAPVGPTIERGQVVDFKPAALPPPPGPPADAPSEAEQREMAKSMLGLDDGQMQAIEAPVITTEAVVRLVDVGVYLAVRMRTVSKRRPWDAEKASAARFTDGAREDIKAFAPFALPYLQQTAASSPWFGLALFGMVCWSAAGDSFSRVSAIEKQRGEDIPPAKAPATGQPLALAQPQAPVAGPPAGGPPSVR